MGADFDMEFIDFFEADSSKPENDSKLEVLMSTGLVSHMKKVLAKDKKSMAVLNKIRGTRTTNIPMQPTTILVKEPTDYPLPPSPESNESDKGNFLVTGIRLK